MIFRRTHPNQRYAKRLATPREQLQLAQEKWIPAIPETCRITNIVYKAEVETNNSTETKEYVGMTSNEFKTSYILQRNRASQVYVASKEKPQRFLDIMVYHETCHAYQNDTKRRNLFLEEKLNILKANKLSLLNRRSELFSKCHHDKKQVLFPERSTRWNEMTWHLLLTLPHHKRTVEVKPSQLPEDREKAWNSE